MKNGFDELGISPPLLKAIEEIGFEAPTEVQSKAIPHILNQEDLIVMSKTGSGKTAAYGIPILQMTDSGVAGPQALVLTPTRELAVQVDSDLKHLAMHLQHRTTAVYGQHSMNIEMQAFNKGVSIVTGTPGRVYDHIQHGNLKTRNIRFLVLDEADRMLDMGFIDQVERIIRTLPKNRITLVFSATIPSEVRKICRDHMKHPATVEIESQTKTVDTIQQMYYRIERNEKCTQLNRLLLVEQPDSCLIFCNTRMAVDRVQSFLSRKGYSSQALHGDIPQAARLKTMQQFKQGEFHLLVATDVAARGIHVDNLSLVINYDVPDEKDSYVHRIGRTGRAGHEGRAITFVTGDDIMSLYEIEEHIGAMIPETELPSDAVFNERRAAAAEWIQANSRKISPAQDASVSGSNDARKKPYDTRNRPSRAQRPQQQARPGNRPVSVNPDHKTPTRSHTGQPDRQAKPAQTTGRPTQTTTERVQSTVRPVQSSGKPAQTSTRPTQTNPRPAQTSTRPTQTNPRPAQTSVRPAQTNSRPAQTSVRPAQTSTRPAQASTRPVQSHTTSADNMSARPGTEMVQDKVSKAGKPFFQRILQRIFGK